MRPDGYLKTAWIMTVLFSIILPLHSQTPRQFSIELKDKPLPAALKFFYTPTFPAFLCKIVFEYDFVI